MKKLSKRVLGAFLAVMMVVTMVPNGIFTASAATQNTYATGDIIEFGSYPQTKVTDESLITALNACTLAADNTVEYADAKYLRVYFTQYMNTYGEPTTDLNNTYQDDNGYYANAVYWFKFEPVQWRILSNTAGELFVLADKILASQSYNYSSGYGKWETSAMRSWLNNEFLDAAFSLSEQAKIKTSAVDNDENTIYSTISSNDTTDKLFLLSYAEAVNTAYGFSSDGYSSDVARRSQGTDFSKSNGLFINKESSYSGNSNWYLRSHNDESAVAFVGHNGYFYGCADYIHYYGVRPAFKINLTSVIPQIVFDTDGGSAVETIGGNVGTAVIAPEEPMKIGYTFGGWNPALPATFPDGGLTATALWISNTCVTGDIVEFGSYPQTEVTDAVLVSVLDTCPLAADNTVYYDGVKYQRVYFTEYITTNGESSGLSLQDDNGYFINMVYWFKFEPIKWRVLSNIAGELFVMSEKILDSKAYNQAHLTNVTWETCTLRSWLNNDFMNTAFSSTEQAKIEMSSIVNDDNPWSGMLGGNDTNDKLFMLSYGDVTNPVYGFRSEFNLTSYDSARVGFGTDFARSNGLLTVQDGVNPEFYSMWHLRSPGSIQYSGGIVDLTGNSFDIDGGGSGSLTYIGTRPAMNIKLSTPSTITFDSAGGTAVADLIGNVGRTVRAPVNPTKSGFDFAGWDPALPLTFPAGGLAVTATWISRPYVTGEIIEFGSYPQTRVIDTVTITALNACTPAIDNTVDYAGAKYQRMYFSQYNYKYGGTTMDPLDSYQDDNGYFIDTVYWFKYEPIQWRVLSNTNNELFVMAEYVLNAKAFNLDRAAVTWETCSMRTWLNNEFYNTAFNTAEKLKIKTSALSNYDTVLGTNGGNDTYDKLFMLTIADVRNAEYGFSVETSIGADTRWAQGTDYSKGNGLSVSTDAASLGKSVWWLRTAFDYMSAAGIVTNKGEAYNFARYVDVAFTGVRPALKINLLPSSTITFDSAGGSAVADITGNVDDPITAPSDPTRTGYTFTGWSPALPATLPGGGLAVTATWNANTYSVTYDANGGTGTTASSYHTYDTAQALTANGFTNTGYGFESWNTAADGSGTVYSNSQSVTNLTAAQGATIILYAQWCEYEYTITDLKVTITKYIGAGGAVTIPETLGGYPVTAIGSRAFFSCYTLTTLTIPDCVETIADDAFFDCGELTKADIGSGAVYISPWAFVSCGKLTQFNVNPANTVYASEDGVLLNAVKTTVITYPCGKAGAYIVPASVTAIGAYAFYRCSNLTSITLPAGLLSIGGAAFDSCYGLQYVIIPAGVSTIGDQAFWFSGNLARVYFLGGAPAFMGNMVFDFCAAGFKVYYLSEHTEFAGSWYGYETEVFALPSFSVRDGSTTVIDQSSGFIYGLEAGLTQAGFESDYVIAGGESRLAYTSLIGAFGTGTTVKLISIMTGEVISTYTIVLFGDVNADGSVDSMDAGMIVDYENYIMPWDPETDAARLKAGDVNGDGSIDSLDAGLIVDAENYMVTIDQSTGLAG